MNEGKPVPPGEAEARNDAGTGAESGVPGRETSGAVPADAEGPAAGGDASSDDSSGDDELGRPVGAGSRGAANAEGDFELERPAAVRAGAGSSDVKGDFEPRRPVALPAGSRAGADAEARLSAAGGDFELERPASVLPGSAARSTPSYGGPGPWAPAPPVQHPAATPAHGTATLPLPTQDAPVPPIPGVPAPGVPAPGVPAPGVPATLDAVILGRDTGYDLAVVKVNSVRGLRPIPLGNSDNVQVGDFVVAIGAPFDLAGTVTSGIISAKERPITAGGEKGDGSDVSYVDALQTDAPINPGNSGGPLLDAKGRVVGINSAIRSADNSSDESGQAGSIGLGFAIPVNQAKRVAEELINTGKATHPVIGVTLDMNYTGDGARVGTKGVSGGSAVTVGGPGDKAGIEPGDVITEVDGVRVHSGEELIVKTRAHRPGDRLELTVVRDGRERGITLVLGSADGN